MAELDAYDLPCSAWSTRYATSMEYEMADLKEPSKEYHSVQSYRQ